MPAATVSSVSPHTSAADDAITRSVERLDPQGEHAEETLAELTDHLVDAVLAADVVALQTAADALSGWINEWSKAAAGRVFGACAALLSASQRALEQLPAADEIAIREDTLAWQFLRVLDSDQRYTSTDLLAKLRTGNSQISRVGKQLMTHGLVAQRRAGRHAYWHLTPRGRQFIRAGAVVSDGPGADPRTLPPAPRPSAVLVQTQRRPPPRRPRKPRP